MNIIKRPTLTLLTLLCIGYLFPLDNAFGQNTTEFTTAPSTQSGVSLYTVDTFSAAATHLLLWVALILLIVGIIFISGVTKAHHGRTIGIAAVIVAAGIFITVMYKNSPDRHTPIIFSPKSVMEATWLSYTTEYLEPVTLRTLDKQQDNITTSEGQSYTMLRSVQLDDKETFDTSWQWTKDNLMREDSNLISWLFGERPDGSYGILTDRGGHNAASDADTDIALALIFAYSRWKDITYLGDAHEIIDDIWEEEVVIINEKPYLAANNLEKALSEKIILNPSYLAPYAYKIFAEIDVEHDWIGLADTSYEVLDRSVTLPLDKEMSVGLPPDWVAIDRTTGELSRVQSEHLTTNFGYDAMRTPWRLAVDWEWNKDERALNILKKMSFLEEEWKRNNGVIYATYTHDGEVVNKYEAPAMYGGTIGYFMAVNPSLAKEVYGRKLAALYDPDRQTWKQVLSYYDDNWVWFGIALYNGLFPNLYKQ